MILHHDAWVGILVIMWILLGKHIGHFSWKI